MTVEDPRGLANEKVLDDIDRALLDFAEWTGRDGVCVPGIRVREDVAPDLDPDWDLVGRYRGEHSTIVIQPGLGSNTHDDVVHELCHAIDWHEDLHDAWADDAFPYDDVEHDSAYPTRAIRSREAFARKCEAGPADMVLANAFDQQCDAGLLTSEQAFLSGVVYTSYPTGVLDPAPFSVTVDARGLDLDPGYAIYDATGYNGSVLLLVDWYDVEADDGYRLRVLVIDPASGVVTSQFDLPGHDANGGEFATSDASPVVVVHDVEGHTSAVSLDAELTQATRIDVSGLPTYVDSAAFMDGLLYVGNGGDDGARLAVWDPTAGTETDLGGDAWVYSLRPTSDGLERSDQGGVYRLDAAGEWTRLATRPYGAWGFVPLAGDLRLWLVGAETSVPVLMDASTGDWRLPEDPCNTAPIVFGGPSAMFSVDGAPFVLGSSRDDGTGAPVLYSLHIDAG